MACLSPPELPGSQPACERGGLIADAMGGTWEPRLQLNLSAGSGPLSVAFTFPQAQQAMRDQGLPVPGPW